MRFDLKPYGISTMAVEPGFFRTELLVEGSSTIWLKLKIDDYAERTAETIAASKGMHGLQGGRSGQVCPGAHRAIRVG